MTTNKLPTQKSFNKAIGGVIRGLRKQKRLSQGNVGDVLDVSYQQIQKSEQGLNGFSTHQLLLLSRLFDVPIGDIYSGALASLGVKLQEAA